MPKEIKPQDTSRAAAYQLWMKAPPHIHAIYGEDTAAFDIRTGALIDGGFPERTSELVREWVDINREALMEMWETQEFKKLDPLA